MKTIISKARIFCLNHNFTFFELRHKEPAIIKLLQDQDHSTRIACSESILKMAKAANSEGLTALAANLETAANLCLKAKAI